MGKIDNHKVSRLRDCHVIDLGKHRHDNGSLTVVENTPRAPFAVRRVFYLYDVPGDSVRGGHSHFEARELIVAAAGSFDVTLTDGHDTCTYTLNRPYKALYIPAGVWRGLDNFSSGSVCLVLTSLEFDEADYCRDFETFMKLTSEKIDRP